METISIEFPARRYHATPWDAHVNEGRIEWPPSPWRLIRALLAVGYNKLGWTDAPSDLAKSVLTKLSEALPWYSLPNATEAHTRHYMPMRDKTAKVFDAFLRFCDPMQPLLVLYDVRLESDERKELSHLLSGLTYLGRAESWAEAKLLSLDDAAELVRKVTWCKPHVIGNGRVVRLLSALPLNEYAAWRKEQIGKTADQLEKTEQQKVLSTGKKLTPSIIARVRAKAEANYPADIFAALHLDTSTWQSQGWPQPPGS